MTFVVDGEVYDNIVNELPKDARTGEERAQSTQMQSKPISRACVFSILSYPDRDSLNVDVERRKELAKHAATSKTIVEPAEHHINPDAINNTTTYQEYQAPQMSQAPDSDWENLPTVPTTSTDWQKPAGDETAISNVAQQSESTWGVVTDAPIGSQTFTWGETGVLDDTQVQDVQSSNDIQAPDTQATDNQQPEGGQPDTTQLQDVQSSNDIQVPNTQTTDDQQPEAGQPDTTQLRDVQSSNDIQTANVHIADSQSADVQSADVEPADVQTTDDQTADVHTTDSQSANAPSNDDVDDYESDDDDLEHSLDPDKAMYDDEAFADCQSEYAHSEADLANAASEAVTQPGITLPNLDKGKGVQRIPEDAPTSPVHQAVGSRSQPKAGAKKLTLEEAQAQWFGPDFSPLALVKPVALTESSSLNGGALVKPLAGHQYLRAATDDSTRRPYVPDKTQTQPFSTFGTHVYVNPSDQHNPFIEIRFNAVWRETATSPAFRTKASLFINKMNLIDLQFSRVQELKDIDFSLFTSVPHANLEEYLSHEALRVTILYNGKPHACNMFTESSKGPFTPVFQSLSSQLDRPCSITLIVNESTNFITALCAFQESIEKVAQDNPLHRWFPKDSKRKFLQLGQLVEAQLRPQYALPPQICFMNLEEYLAVSGMGMFQEHEYRRAITSPIIGGANVRFFSMPRCDNRQYLLLIEQTEEFVGRLQPGDKLNVSMLHITAALDAARQEEEKTLPTIVDKTKHEYPDWHAKIIEKLPFVHFNDICAIIHRPFDKESGQWVHGDVGLTPSFMSFKTSEDARAAFHRATPHVVDITPIYDNASEKRESHALLKTQDLIQREKQMNKGGSVTETILLANTFKTLPEVDLYDCLTDADADAAQAYARSGANEDQGTFVDGLRNMHGGLALIEGPPGTGKTRTMVKAVAPLVLSGEKKILALSCLNENADDLARHLRNELQKSKPDVIVLRAFARSTEDAIFFLEPDKTRPRSRPSYVDETQPIDHDIEEFFATSVFLTSMANATKLTHGVNDKRVSNEFKHSIAYYMCIVSGVIISDSPHARYDDWRELQNGIAEYAAKGADMDSDMLAQLKREVTALREYCLQSCDCLCTTFSQAADARIYDHFAPEVIIIDEANKAGEAETRIALGFYPRTYKRILAGDTQQTRPFVSSDSVYNGFARQLGVSLFTRLILAGFRNVHLFEQHRFPFDINRAISTNFYHGRLTTAVPDDKPSVIRFRKFVRESFGLTTSICCLAVERTTVITDKTGSKSNKETTSATWEVIARLAEFGYQPEDIALIAPYRAAVTVHDRHRAHYQTLAENGNGMFPEPKAHLSKLMIQTFDSLEGKERPVVVVDMVIADKVGFLSDANRINVALSRAQDGLIIVADYTSMQNINHFDKKKIGKVFEYLRKARVICQPQNHNMTPTAVNLPFLMADSDDADRTPIPQSSLAP